MPARKRTRSKTQAGTLREYRRKRDFATTREPAGTRAPRRQRKGPLAFVIQKHAASSLHYDLRLELDGAMRSWAVPKGPSLDPSVKRLAMQVEDHPIEYNTFEGTIPEGEYGGGTVMLWDRGTYAPDDARPDESPDDAVRRGLEAGKLSFTLRGDRVRGSFALVRTGRGAKPRWLLIKHRDEDAQRDTDITALVQTSVASGRTMDEIAAESDRVWHSGRPARTKRKRAKPGPPEDVVIAPMQPKPSREPPDRGRWTFEVWHGGARVLAYVTDEAARLVDGRARDITSEHRAIAGELATLAGRVGRPFVLDGEIVDANGAATLHAADLLLDGDDVLLDEPWESRHGALERLLRRRRVKHVALEPTSDDARAALRRAARDRAPGVVAYRNDAAYEPGARSDAMRRITLL